MAEFNGGLNNFQRVWERDHYAQDTILGDYGGHAIGDWDRDGRKEFVVSFTFGNTVVLENTSNNSYQKVWQDSIPFVNLVYGTSGDVDDDGSPEFFRGATMYDDNWTLVYEADINNHYSPTFLFHLLTSGTFDEPTYSTSDIDGDGAVELIILSGSHLLVFKSDFNDSYYLWYYRRVLYQASVATYDFDGAGQKSFILSKWILDSTYTHLRFAADVYKPGPALSVEDPDEMLPVR